MKTTRHAFILAIVAITFVTFALNSFCATEIKEGDDIATVKEVLGKPTGSIKSENFHLLYYDRGKVEIRHDKVTMIDLMSEEELATKKKTDKENVRLAAEKRAQNTFEGEKLKQEKLSNHDFVTSSYSNQVRFWRAFKKKHPYVSISKEYEIALTGLEKEIKEEQAIVAALEEKARTEQRIKDLENRLAEAEAREQQQKVIYTAPTVYYYSPYTSHTGYRSSNPYHGYHRSPKQPCTPYTSYPHRTDYSGYGLRSDVYLSNGSITFHGSF